MVRFTKLPSKAVVYHVLECPDGKGVHRVRKDRLGASEEICSCRLQGLILHCKAEVDFWPISNRSKAGAGTRGSCIAQV